MQCKWLAISDQIHAALLFCRLMAQVCQEGANIFQASCATQASSLLSPQSAFQAALEVAKITSTNRSSMLQDIERGRQTEVAFINGFLVREAHRLGLGAPVNALLESLVSAKATLAASLLHSV